MKIYVYVYMIYVLDMICTSILGTTWGQRILNPGPAECAERLNPAPAPSWGCASAVQDKPTRYALRALHT